MNIDKYTFNYHLALLDDIVEFGFQNYTFSESVILLSNKSTWESVKTKIDINNFPFEAILKLLDDEIKNEKKG